MCCTSAVRRQGKTGAIGASVVAMGVAIMVVLITLGARPTAYADELPTQVPRLCLTAGTDANGGQGCRSVEGAESWDVSWHSLGHSVLTPEGLGTTPNLGVSRAPKGGAAGPAWPWSGWTHLDTATAVERPDRPLCAAPMGLITWPRAPSPFSSPRSEPTDDVARRSETPFSLQLLSVTTFESRKCQVAAAICWPEC
jgi:hypothetical protein